MDEKIRQKFGDSVHIFTMETPLDYIHENQLILFKKKYLSYFTSEFSGLSDKKSKKTSDKLIAGKSYQVHFHEILDTTYAMKGLVFLQEQKSLLVGPQGLSLIWDLHKFQFPSESIYALDLPENCYTERKLYHPVVMNDGEIPIFYYTPFGALFQGGFLISIFEKH